MSGLLNVSIGVLAAILLASTGLVQAEPLLCGVSLYGDFTHIDPVIGQVPPTRNDLPASLQALAWSPGGTLYAGRSGDLYTVDPWTGHITHYLSITSDVRGMAFSPSGALYVTAGDVPQELRIINLTDGTYTSVGQLTGGEQSAQGMAFAQDGTLYGVSPHAHIIGTYTLSTIDLDDAEMHVVGTYTTANINQSITFTPDGHLYALGESQFAELDPTNGAIISPIIGLVGDYRGLAYVPEPATLGLLLAGGLALLNTRRLK